MTNSNQRKIGVVLQYLQMALGIVIQLLYTPVVLRILGQNEYGIYNLASSTISYLSLLSLGFGASYIRYYSKYKVDNDEKGISKLNGLYLLVFLIIGIITLICGFVLTNNVNIFFNDTYTEKEVDIARILMGILTINMAISFPTSVFSSYVTSQEKFIFQKIINMGKTVISPIMCIIVLYNGFGSIGMVIVTTVLTLLVDTINIFYCFFKLKMRISFKNPDFALLKDIFVFSIFIAMNQIIDQINWQTDKIILGKVVNGSAVAIYAVGANINTMFTQFSVAVSGVYSPKVNAIVMKKEEDMNEQLTNLFIKVGRVQWFILSLILSGFIVFGNFFIIKWAGEDYSNAYWVALLLMSPAIIPLVQNIGIEIQRAKNKHQFRSIVYLLMAFINVGVSIWFAFLWGEIGTALGTTISLLIANGLIMNIYYQKKLGINVIRFWKSIISTLPGYILPICLGVSIMMFYDFKSLVDFCLFIALYVLVFGLSIYFLGINKEEKNIIKNTINKVLRRNND